MSADRRLIPARPDLAAESLRGIIESPRYVSGEGYVVREPVAPLRRAPSPGASLDTEGLMGERVTVYDIDGEGWAWGQLDADGYVGFLPINALGAPAAPPTHRVRVPRTFLYPQLDIKRPPLAALSFGSLVAVRSERDGFAVTAGGALFARHLEPIATRQTDFVAVAAGFLDTPYLWGGRSAFGIDCSGLVQTALNACSIAAPRDSDMQEAALGIAIDIAGPFQRGDLLFWPGHVAIVEADDLLLHANAFHMMVAREPLGAALARIAAVSPLRSAKRL